MTADEVKAREEYRKILGLIQRNRNKRRAINERLETLNDELGRVLDDEVSLMERQRAAGQEVLASIERAEHGACPVEPPKGSNGACDTMRLMGYCDCY